MIGTLINTVAILLGTAVGLLARKSLNDRLKETVVQGEGLCVMLIGLTSALKTSDTMCVIICIVVGGLIGSAVNIELRLNQLGGMLEKRFAAGQQEGSIAKGFVSASLIYCVGAMAIVGAMDSGLRGDHSTLIAKSMLDGVTSIFLAGSMGIGVGLSAFAVLAYQGLIAILAGWLEPLLTAQIIAEMGAVGGLLIMGIGLNMIYDRQHIPVGNMLPAIFLPMLYIPIVGLF